MLFNSTPFIFFFFPLTVALFFLVGRASGYRARIVLALLSLAFYAYWDWRFLPLFLLSIGINYAAGLAIYGRVRAGQQGAAKRNLILGIVFNLALLSYFKYADLFLTTYNALAPTPIDFARTILPIGISFFTFTQIAFLIDVYQDKVKDFDAWDYVLFVSYFPHQIAGPILHNKEMMSQFRSMARIHWSSTLFGAGLSIFAWGLFKKILIADPLSDLANPIFGAAEVHGALTLFEAWGGALAYTLQLYFDFSAYCDMAIGISLVFGIRLPINFNSPYKALNIIDFWQRWHMTLSRFLRDYLYIPLGGNRKGPARRYLNLLITMGLGGLWHGAAWTFLFWGLLHGCYLLVNHAWREYSPSLRYAPSRDHPLWKAFCWTLTFLAVLVAWVFFRANSFHGAYTLLGAMFGSQGLQLPKALHALSPYLPHASFSDGWLGTLPGAGGVAMLVVGLLICLVMPNAQEVFHEYQPALVEKPVRKPRLLEWRPSTAWAVGLALAMGVAISRLGNDSQFLYFNF